MAQLGNGVTIAELAAMLNTAQEVQAICTSPLINKWSKRKPVHHSQSSPLSDEQMRGMSTEHSQGIYYGLKAGVDTPTAANIHAADWSYVGGPQGGTSSWYRVDDFWGYEKDAQYPTLSGSGLADGQEAIYTNNTNIATTLLRSSLTSIVDIAEVFGGNLDYARLYLVVLVGNYARAMICADTGTISPIVSNGIDNKTFHFPDMTPIINTNSLPMTAKVSVFLVDNTAIGTFRDAWVDMTLAVNIGNKPITLPHQVGLNITFKGAGKIYITALSLAIEESRGTKFLATYFTAGPDWDEAAEYRVLYNVTAASGGTGSYAEAVEKYDFTGAIPTSAAPMLDSVMSGAGFVKGAAANYTIKADFQVKAMSTSSWTTTGHIKTISISW